MEPQRRPNHDQTQHQAQYWNGPEANHWLVHEHRYERMGAPFTRLVLDAASVARADHVLDVGCGTGSTTCAAARVAADGQALGVDIARPLLQRAKQRARHDGLTNVRFEHGDAQTHRLAPGGFDAAISRFGVMFFSDPTAAFANIARGLRPGGRIAFVCWQPVANNEWITVLSAAAARRPWQPGTVLAGRPAAPGGRPGRCRVRRRRHPTGRGVDVAGSRRGRHRRLLPSERVRPKAAPRRRPRNAHPGHGGGAGRAGAPSDLRRCSTRIPGVARHRPQPPVSERRFVVPINQRVMTAAVHPFGPLPSIALPPRPDESRPGAEAMPENTMTTTQPTPISVHGLTKQFGRIRAVEELTFDVRPGQITGFLGPNGAGKTTTLRMLLGLVRPTAGVALIGGQPYPSLPHPRRTVGAVLETTGAHPGRRARDHLQILAQVTGVPDGRVCVTWPTRAAPFWSPAMCSGRSPRPSTRW